jgi:rhodanese-related sulfurtransferase
LKANQHNPEPLSSDGGALPPSSPRAGRNLRAAFIAARLIMAGIFIYASIEKIAHPAAFAKDVYNYQILPDALINLTALVLPWLELLLGLGLLAGIWLPGAVLLVNGLLLVFLAAFVFNLARGLDVDCGCFGAGGVGPPMATHWYLLRDAGFLAVGAFLFYAVFGNRRRKAPERADSSRESKRGWGLSAWQASALVIVSAVAALAVNAQRTDRLPLVGDWSVAGRITTDAGERIDISLAEAQQLFASQAAVFIDARPAADYARGHIRGARSLPWHDVDQKFIDVTQDLELENPIVAYCDGETCELSHNLALFLREAGFANTRVLVDGWKIWQQSGGPVESGTRPAQQ